MAGVGFELRALSAGKGLLGRARGLTTAGVLSCGPWLLSMLMVLAVGRLGHVRLIEPAVLEQFQVAITWLFAASLIWTAPLQLMFTRFAADREYLNERADTLPNLFGAMTCTSVLSSLLAGWASLGFEGESVLLRVALGTAFVVACNVWLVVIVLAGERQHLRVLGCFAFGYAITLASCGLLADFGAAGLVAGFALGQASLLFGSLGVLARGLPTSKRGAHVGFRFLRHRLLYFELGFTGLFYNLGVWSDELMFWFDPATSQAVLGPLRASQIYDLPSFAAAVSLVPAMGVFLLRVETDFAERQRAFYDAIHEGAALPRIETLAGLLTEAARRGIASVVRVQVASGLAAACFGSWWLSWLGGVSAGPATALHLPMFHLALLAASLQMVVLTTLSMFFYLDRRAAALRLALLLCVSNISLTWLTQQFGPSYYGFGSVLSLGLTCLVGLSWLNTIFGQLVRDTFMLQPGAAT